MLRMFLSRICFKLIMIWKKWGQSPGAEDVLNNYLMKEWMRITHKVALCFLWFYAFQIQSHPARLYHDNFVEAEREFKNATREQSLSTAETQQSPNYWVLTHGAFLPYCTLVTTWTFLDLSGPKSIAIRGVEDGAQPEHRQKMNQWATSPGASVTIKIVISEYPQHFSIALLCHLILNNMPKSSHMCLFSPSCQAV